MYGWEASPLVPLPETERLREVKRENPLGICKGGCNRLCKIYNKTYQICESCSHKYRYFGRECDVPNCTTISDGANSFYQKDGKFACHACFDSWKVAYKFCVWERFVEERHLYFIRPKTYAKALEEGIVSEIPNPVKFDEVAECQFCYEYKRINVPKYQLCNTCSKSLQYHGEKCSIKGKEPCPNDAYGFDKNESRFVCKECQGVKARYKISSYRIYETQIRTITECQCCGESISHNKEEGAHQCTACIDHDHDKQEVRGILCNGCNISEGQLKNKKISFEEWGRNMDAYVQNPPLSKSWMQE